MAEPSVMHKERGFGLAARLTVCAVALLAAGCTIRQRTWAYHSNSYPVPKERGTKLAVVLPFEDRRDPLNVDRSMIGLIPFVPYGRSVQHTPPDVQLLIKPAQYFAESLADELNASGRYKHAYFNRDLGDADYVFKGDILNTDFSVKVFSYGLSIFGGLPWLFGLPETEVTNRLSLKLICGDRNGRILFQKAYSADPYRVYLSPYYMRPSINYANMTRQIYGEFVNDLVSNNKCI